MVRQGQVQLKQTQTELQETQTEAQQAPAQNFKLAAKLREMGIDPKTL